MANRLLAFSALFSQKPVLFSLRVLPLAAWLAGSLLPFVTRAQDCAPPPSGLVHWWQGEGVAVDAVGDLSGTLINGTTFAGGTVGQAFSFDGVNDYISTRTPVLNSIVDSYTLEFWAFPTASRASTPEATGGIWGTSAQRYAIYPRYQSPGIASGVSVGTNGVSVFEHGNDYLPALLVYDAPIEGWNHIVVVYESRQPRLYVNGALVRIGLTSEYSSSPTTFLGEAGQGYGYYRGLLDEVSIYDRALSDVEVQEIYSAGGKGKCPLAPFISQDPTNQIVVIGQKITLSVLAGGSPPLCYQWWKDNQPLNGATNASHIISRAVTNDSGNYTVVVTNVQAAVTSVVAVVTVNPPVCSSPPAGLVGWWKGDNSPADQAGTNHGTLFGNATFGQGMAGNGFVLDGNGDYVQIGNPANLQMQNFTIESWVKRGSTSSISFDGFLGMVFAWGNGGYGLYLDGSGRPTLTKLGINNIPLMSAAITDTNFHHLAVTKSGSTVVFYIDGTAYPVGPYDPGFTFSTRARIGSWDNSGHSFYGTIDEVAVYNRALDSDEIRSIYDASSEGKCAPTAPPSIVSHPQGATLAAGASTNLNVLALGWPAPVYQWRWNDVNLPGATRSSLAFTNIQPSQAGVYSVLVTNTLGAELSSNATLKVRVVTVLGNGQPLTSAQYTYGAAVTIQLQNAFAGGLICYTTDGSEPSFASTQYTGPFTVSNTVTLRAIGYSLDFWESGQTDPIVIAVLPTYTLTATTPGGGSVARNPSASSYVSNSVVTLTATPASGWAFLQWTGDATGGNPTTEIVMNGNKSAQAVFGTALGTTVAGNGAVAASPALPLYPFGAVVQLTALPQPGNYFGLWGNAAGGTTNPLYFVVTNSGRTVSSIFGAVGGGQAALTVVPVGKGRVTVNPRTNVCNVGQALTLTAVPNAGRTFLRWSGDTAGTANPLSLTMNQSKVIYAHFTGAPEPAVQPGADGLQPGGFQFRVTADLGDRYQIEGSTNLMNWDALATLTNYAPGPSPLLDVAATNSPRRFYRAVLLP